MAGGSRSRRGAPASEEDIADAACALLNLGHPGHVVLQHQDVDSGTVDVSYDDINTGPAGVDQDLPEEGADSDGGDAAAGARARRRRNSLAFSDIVGGVDSSDSEGETFTGIELLQKSASVSRNQVSPTHTAAPRSGLKIVLPPLSGRRKGPGLSTPSPTLKGRQKKAKTATARKHRSSSSKSAARASEFNLKLLYQRQKRRESFEEACAHLSKPWGNEPPSPTAAEDLEDEPASASPKPAKRRRGRPPKANTVVPPTATERQEWSASVFLQVEWFEEVQKTARSQKKMESRKWRGGPITVTHRTTWSGFLAMVADAANVATENLVVASLTWRIMPGSVKGPQGSNSAPALPMTDQAGFQAFVKTGILGNVTSCAFLVSMSPPVAVKKVPDAPWHKTINSAMSLGSMGTGMARAEEVSDDSDMEGAKGKAKGKAKSKTGLDERIIPIVEKLKEKYYIGCCELHPGTRCFHDTTSDLHFDLDPNRLSVWAAAILKGVPGVDYDHIPIGSHFFEAKLATRVAPAAAAFNQRQGFRSVSDPLSYASAHGPSFPHPYPHGSGYPGAPPIGQPYPSYPPFQQATYPGTYMTAPYGMMMAPYSVPPMVPPPSPFYTTPAPMMPLPFPTGPPHIPQMHPPHGGGHPQ